MSNFSIAMLYAGCALATTCLLGRRYFYRAWASLEAHRTTQRQIQADRAKFYGVRDELLKLAGHQGSTAFVLSVRSAVTRVTFSFHLRRMPHSISKAEGDKLFALAMKELDRAREILSHDLEKQGHDMRMLCLAGEVMDELRLVYGQAFKSTGDSLTTSASVQTRLNNARALADRARASYDEGDAEACDSFSRQGLTELVAFFKEIGVAPPPNLSVSAS